MAKLVKADITVYMNDNGGNTIEFIDIELEAVELNRFKEFLNDRDCEFITLNNPKLGSVIHFNRSMVSFIDVQTKEEE